MPGKHFHVYTKAPSSFIVMNNSVTDLKQGGSSRFSICPKVSLFRVEPE